MSKDFAVLSCAFEAGLSVSTCRVFLVWVVVLRNAMMVYCLMHSVLTVPGYISRSVAGSYDNEGIAIFALMFTYYLWVSLCSSSYSNICFV